MGPRAGLDRCGKFRPPPGYDPRIFQPVTSRYTDYATRPTSGIDGYALLASRFRYLTPKNKLCVTGGCSDPELSLGVVIDTQLTVTVTRFNTLQGLDTNGMKFQYPSDS